ncbi:hypothetical protein ACQKM9_00355 [Viridibacillus sp. NPDC093762]|uniref:hypothetical protein n=1 Tax=Viridibacillus sp. NPDC093762 TaxID=3390720 RepID=UPI003CFCAE82
MIKRLGYVIGQAYYFNEPLTLERADELLVKILQIKKTQWTHSQTTFFCYNNQDK